MTINERFQTIIDILFGGNKRAFAIHVGISPTVVENIVGKRKGKPSFDVLEKVCANANISAEWLLIGKGELFFDMIEGRKLPMQYHHTPELYMKEGKTEVTDDEEASLSQSEDESPPEHISESHKILLNLLKDKDHEIGRLNQEIGRLSAKIEELERVRPVSTIPQYAHTSETVPT